MFEIAGEIPEPIFGELEEAESLGENGTPLLEVRRCGDGRPPVTKREREIRLNGISGVIFLETRIEIFDPGFLLVHQGQRLIAPSLRAERKHLQLSSYSVVERTD